MNNRNLLVRFDWVIKAMLRNKANFDILEGFLTALLKDNITVLEILESESNQETARQKFNRVDVLIRDSQGRKMIIEVQSEYESDFLERLLFGVSKVIIEHFQLGEPYSAISKVISISVQYFNLGIGNDYIYHGGTVIRGMRTGDELKVREGIEDIIDGETRIKLREKNIFPEYYIISVNRYKDIVKEDIDEWIYMMKNNVIEDSFHSKNIDKAREKLKILNMSEEDRLAYEKYLMNTAIEKDILSSAKAKGLEEGHKKGLQEGIEKGLQKGIEKGLQEGIEKGLQEGIEKGHEKGLKEGIEMAIDIKFGELGEGLKNKIQEIKNMEKLYEIKKGLVSGKSISEIENILP